MQVLQIQEPDQIDKEKRVAIGIDFGTTNSLVAFSEDKKPKVFADVSSNKKIPSVVSVDLSKKIYVGSEAQSISYDQGVVSVKSIKRLIGKERVEIDNSFSAIDHVIEKSGKVYLSMNGIELNVEEISARILEKIKSIASDNLKEDVKDAVVTVPAYFDEMQRRVVIAASEAVGLNVIRIINEPTAAALAYQLDSIEKGTYLVYDLGGGTFDVSILNIQKGVFRVIATGGDSNLGGDDFDYIIAREIEKQNPSMKFSVALSHAREIKEKLTDHESVDHSIDGDYFTISRKHFESLSSELLSKTLNITKHTLQDCDIEDFSGIILVGGSTRMPFVKKALSKMFPNVDFYNSINPDEVVAMGAALQAENLTRGGGDLLLDVTPLSLGLEIMGGLNEKIIHRNSSIPCSISKEFTTYENGQTGIKLHVTQGEREIAKDCRSLAHFELNGIPPMQAGQARVNVTFTIDADGLLTVSAEEKTKGVKQSVEILPTYGLDSEEIERSLRKSIENAERDHRHRLLLEAKINAEKILSKISSDIEQDKDLLSEEEYNSICQKMNSMEFYIESGSKEKIEDATRSLEKSTEQFFSRKLRKYIDA